MRDYPDISLAECELAFALPDSTHRGRAGVDADLLWPLPAHPRRGQA